MVSERTKDYGRKFSEKSFWRKVGRYAKVAGRQVVEKGLTLYYCLEDKDTPKRAKALIIGSLGYFIMPVDAIPDLAPLVGYTDDLGVIVMTLSTVAASLKREHWEKAALKTKDWFGEK